MNRKHAKMKGRAERRQQTLWHWWKPYANHSAGKAKTKREEKPPAATFNCAGGTKEANQLSEWGICCGGFPKGRCRRAGVEKCKEPRWGKNGRMRPITNEKLPGEIG